MDWQNVAGWVDLAQSATEKIIFLHPVYNFAYIATSKLYSAAAMSWDSWKGVPARANYK